MSTSEGPAAHDAAGANSVPTARDIPWLLDQQAARFADRPFLIWQPVDGPSDTYSFARFSEETRACAVGLESQGIRLGDAVALHLDNHPAMLVAWFACARLGAVAVTTNTRSSAEELRYFLEHSGAKAVVTEARYLETAAAAAPPGAWISTVDECDASGALPFAGLRGDPGSWTPRPVLSALPCNIMYTSGTTSRPKGVVWTHANAVWAAHVNAAHLRLTPDDRAMVFLPLFHAVALSWNTLASLGSGGSLVLLPRFSARRFWATAREHGCTWANMVGFTLKAVEAQPDPPEHHFRAWVCAGDLDGPRARWGIRTLGAFGMTELVCHPIVTDLDHTGPMGAMGRPAPEYQVSLRRADGAPAPAGEIADLWIRGVPGVSIFQSYLNNPEATAEAFDADGWFCTGDQVVGLPDGNLMYAGRLKDMLRVGGENVAAIEIETVIAQVVGVTEVAVVGRPDEMLDEAPVAFVVASEPGEDLQRRILERCAGALADFKRPRAIHFLEALPRGLMDKILKRDLRDLAARLADDHAAGALEPQP